MSSPQVVIDESRERTRLLFEAGAVSTADIVAWADGKIAGDSSPSQELIAFSMAAPDEMRKLLHAWPLPGPTEALAIISEIYQIGSLDWAQSWKWILETSKPDGPLDFADKRLWDVCQIVDMEFPNWREEASELLHAILFSPTEAHAL